MAKWKLQQYKLIAKWSTLSSSDQDIREYFYQDIVGIGLRKPISQILPEVVLQNIDHCVENQDWDEMKKVYE